MSDSNEKRCSTETRAAVNRHLACAHTYAHLNIYECNAYTYNYQSNLTQRPTQVSTRIITRRATSSQNMVLEPFDIYVTN